MTFFDIGKKPADFLTGIPRESEFAYKEKVHFNKNVCFWVKLDFFMGKCFSVSK